MIRTIKSRVLSVILVLAMVFSCLVSTPYSAYAADDIQSVDQSMTDGENPVVQTDAEGIQPDNNSGITKEAAEDSEITEDGEDKDQEPSEEETEDEAEGEAYVGYVYVSAPEYVSSDTMEIFASLYDTEGIIDAGLTLENTATGASTELAASEITDKGVVFRSAVSGVLASGIYRLGTLSLDFEENTQDIDLFDIGIDAQFGVNEECEADPDAVVVDPDEDQAVAEAVSGEGIAVVEIDPESAEPDVEVAIQNSARMLTALPPKNNKDYVIILDPGHGGTDGGAGYFGVYEKELNLKIAKACKAELEKYSGVKVYLTRTDDTTLALADRIIFARDKAADLFVSIHLNAVESGNAEGAMVYYPSENYRKTIGQQGKDLAASVEKELVALGLKDQGIKVRLSDDGTKYEDNSTTDYYYVIRNAKKQGFPGIIIEHAFLSSESDFKTYLNSDAKLAKLGVADATGIAKYLNLAQGTWEQVGSKWKFRYPNNTYAGPDKWLKISGSWYHFDSSYYRQTGWFTDTDGKKYYLSESSDGSIQGRLQLGWFQIGSDWYYSSPEKTDKYKEGEICSGWIKDADKDYYLASDGKMYSGWATIDSKKYYFNEVKDADGPVGCKVAGPLDPKIKGWVQVGKKWFFFEDDYTIHTGWLYRGANTYYMDTHGIMQKGFQKIGSDTYYFNESKNKYGEEGVMLKGTVVIDGTYYEFDNSGKMIDHVPSVFTLKGGKYYYIVGGVNQTGWQFVENRWYFFDDDGTMHTGWLERSGKKYYLDNLGRMVKGWQEFASKKYYFMESKNAYGAEGQMAVGSVIIKNRNYAFDKDGVLIGESPEEFTVKDGKVYYFVNGKAQTGWKEVNSNWYYFNAKGEMQMGWLTAGTNKYYLDGTGALATGWREVDNAFYYFNESKNSYGPIGCMHKGWTKVGSDWFYLNDKGIMQIGWLLEGGKWYYLDIDGTMQVGFVTVKGKTYYLNEVKTEKAVKGEMLTGWQKLDGYWYFFTESGAMTKGFYTEGKYTYYLDSASGKMVTDWRKADGVNWYYFNPTGTADNPKGNMAKGWTKISGEWYFFDESGKMAEGWIKDDGKWYYLEDGGSGIMTTGWLIDDGYKYYLTETADGTHVKGEMVTGWMQISGVWYYFYETATSGKPKGSMATGWVKVGDFWYFMESNGKMKTGWYTEGTTQYYLNESKTSKGPKGALVATIKTGTNIMTEEEIFYYLKSKGFTDAGAAGLMGNLFAESGLRSNNLQNSYESSLGMNDDQYTNAVDNGSYTGFKTDKAGYGLAQWTASSRKTDLYNYCKSLGTSISNSKMQLDFLYKELSTESYYNHVFTLLKTSSSVSEVSDAVLTEFEQPADQSAAVKLLRTSYGTKYYNKYAK